MKKCSVQIFIVLILIFITKSALAQPKIIVTLDTAYAHGGKVEIPLSGFGDEITDFYGIFPDIHDSSKITICGKIGTNDPNIKKIGLIQLNPKGTFDSTFGNSGKTILNWGGSDYPNSMLVVSDSSSDIFLAGASQLSKFEKVYIPAVYKFKKNGKPDSSFGGDGRVALGSVGSISGSFNNIYTEDTTFLACGSVSSSGLLGGINGFSAMRFFANGKLDSSFGVQGKAIILGNVHSVYGFLTKNASVTFIGADNGINKSQLVLGRLTPKGVPDSTFGKNGIINTGIFMNESFGSLVAGIQPDYKIVAAISPTGISGLMPVTLVRLTSDGIIDSAYGTNGFVTVAFTPGVSRARGINIAKNAKTVVAGSAVGNLEQCATSRNNLDGSSDISLNQIGTAVVDVDSGVYSNYIIRFVGIGLKRYIGVGASIHNGISQFLIARFKDDTLQTGGVSKTDNNPEVCIYPNPVSSNFTVETHQEMAGAIKIIDALGREVKRLPGEDYSYGSKKYLFDASNLMCGIYYCIISTGIEKVMKKFIVAH